MFNREVSSFSQARLLLVTVGVLGLDQLTKYVAEINGTQITVNSGISLGLLASMSPEVVTSITTLVWIGIAAYLIKSAKLSLLGKALVLGGGFSNVLDRFIWGGVRDWLPVPGLHLSNNLADYAIVIGFLILVIESTKLKPIQVRLK